MTRYGMLIDTSRCVNCSACRAACQLNNKLEPTESYIKFEHVEEGTYPNVRFRTAPRQCAHCEDAPCARVCPTQATYVADDGTVQLDESKCIGCGYCAAVCPYDARIKRESTGVVSKCSLCHERLERGEAPLCVGTCPVGARVFGDLDDADSELNREIALRGAKPLGDGLTGSRLYYVR